MLSGDNFNKEMAQKRNIDFYCTRDLNLSLDKSQFLQIFEEKYNVPIENMAFVGDDYFDLTIIKKLDYTFCPSDSPKIVKDECEVVLKSVGGDGVIVELYDVLVNKYFNEPSLNDVLELDKKEISSEEMC
jgi:3-deoxy-D-manno-octulosonate 8-phosphate phosphatase KdsC-like HAD superfamily phosphatase